MAFPNPNADHVFVVPKQLLVLLFLLDCVIFILSRTLFFLGLSPTSEARQPPSWEEVFPSQVTDSPESLSAARSSIKSQLPVVEFASLQLKRSHEALEEEEAMCAVCLCCLEERDEVRELGNCIHAFHKGCIDRWMDIGRLTCPLCRSKLMPRKTLRKTMDSFLAFCGVGCA